jgi:hypothetical protein
MRGKESRAEGGGVSTGPIITFEALESLTFIEEFPPQLSL